jgi:hypothetical protein
MLRYGPTQENGFECNGVRSFLGWRTTLCAKAIETCFAKAEQSLRTTTQRMPQNDFIVSVVIRAVRSSRGRRPSKGAAMNSKCFMRTFNQSQALELERSPPGLRKKRKTPYSYRNKTHSSNQCFGKHFKFGIHTHEKRKPI